MELQIEGMTLPQKNASGTKTSGIINSQLAFYEC